MSVAEDTADGYKIPRQLGWMRLNLNIGSHPKFCPQGFRLPIFREKAKGSVSLLVEVVAGMSIDHRKTRHKFRGLSTPNGV